MGQKLWKVLTPEQQKLILFQRRTNDPNNPNTAIKTPQSKPNFKTVDSIVKNPNKQQEQQEIPKQYNSKRTQLQWEQEEDETLLMEELTGCNNLKEAYAQICKANNVYRLHNTILCQAHVEYIMRLSRQEKNKSLAIIDSGADTHVFGCGWTPLFVQDNHTPLADLIGFDESCTKKRGLTI